MYYMAKDPVPQPGEKEETPRMERLPVTDGTPQFRDFHLRNVACKGAGTGLLIRGLPEMAIRNITLENVVLEATRGIVCTEADDISLKNVTVITPDPTLAWLSNVQDMTFDNLRYRPGTEVVLHVQGGESGRIRVLNTDTKGARTFVKADREVAAKAVQGLK